MKPLYVNREGTINAGALAGTVGTVVAFDSEDDKAAVQLDDETQVIIASGFIDQED